MLKSRRHQLQAFHGRKHRDRRGDDAVAVKQRGADHPKQNKHWKLDASGYLIGRDKGEQRQDSAFAIIVGAQHEDHVFQRYHDHQCPKNERDDPENLGRGRSWMADAGQRDLESVERTCADVAEYDAKRGQRQKPRTARMMKEYRLVVDRSNLIEVETSHRAIDQAAGRGTRWHIHMNLTTRPRCLSS